ncbi:glycosyltransferase [Mesorhizobium sp. ArgA1]
MYTAVVVPCLNEQATLADSARSLGFSGGATPPDTILILVDNGSTDSTTAVMKEIQENSVQPIILGQTHDRGYVPPRHHGVMLAKAFADEHGIPDEQLLILQADADTDYGSGYIAAMKAAAQYAPQSLVEGVARAPRIFLETYPGYQSCCDLADDAVASLFVDEIDEVIVDDKVAGLGLASYLKWGGHRREFDAHGDEIHAETSRLYIHGKTLGATRIRVPDAVAYPSRRKIEADPLATFVTAGFPRESRWWEKWRAQHSMPMTLRDFDRPGTIDGFAKAVFDRQVHDLILFALVPLQVRIALGIPAPMTEPCLAAILQKVKFPDTLTNGSGRLFEKFFSLADEEPWVFADCIGDRGEFGPVADS